MRKIIFTLLLTIVCFGQSRAQSQADTFMKQAEEQLERKEYAKARYSSLQAYNAYAANEAYDQAALAGAQAGALYHRENLYKEAFDLLRAGEQLLTIGEQKSGKAMPLPRFRIIKERLQMYINLKNPQRAKEQLTRLEETARTAGNDSLNDDLLYTQAYYYYTFGLNTQGDQCFAKLIGRYKQLQQYDKVSDSYRTLIGIATKAGNTPLVTRTYENYILWTDSVKALTARDELASLTGKYDESRALIEEKETALATRQYIIVGLCTLAAILVGALVAGAVLLLRFLMLIRKQKKAIQAASELAEQKNHFIRNISAQIEPTLATLPDHPGVKALRAFTAHIQELSSLESSLSQPYETEEKSVPKFCEGLQEKMKGRLQPDVTFTVNAPKLSIRMNSEQLSRVLLHLLENAARHTPTGGKISLDFKKRGAHTSQFIVTDSGPGIPEELRESLFKPFSEVRELTQGDGLGLPICSLVAIKMNGSLTLDSTYTKGTRFVLEQHG